MKPIRVQRKRTKGCKMPENTVSVTRPGKYGNPFILLGDQIYLNVKYRRPNLYPGAFFSIGDQEYCVELFRMLLSGDLDGLNDPYIHYWENHFKELDLSVLKGKNLACFCSLDKHCHADVLLEIANK